MALALLFEMTKSEERMGTLVEALEERAAEAFVYACVRSCNYYVTDKLERFVRRLLELRPRFSLRFKGILHNLLRIKRYNEEHIKAIQEYVQLIRHSPCIENKQRIGEFSNSNYLDIDNVIRFKIFMDNKIQPLLKSFNDGNSREAFMRKLVGMEWDVAAQQMVERVRALVEYFGGVRLFLALDIEVVPIDEFLAYTPSRQLQYFAVLYDTLYHHHESLSAFANEIIVNHVTLRDLTKNGSIGD